MPPVIRPRVKTTKKGDVSFKELIGDMKRLGKNYVSVGILDPQRPYPDSKATLGQVALWQEFGTHDRKGFAIIPPRSFLRTPVDQGRAGIQALKTRLLVAIQDRKMTVDKGLASIGADVVRRMQNAIKQRIDPPLAPYTLKMRREAGIKGTVPLYATKFLYKAIHFAVRTFGFKDVGKKEIDA